MAKFLNTKKTVSELEDLIKHADQTLYLISPYLKLSKDFKELLDYRNKKDKVTTIIFGKQELSPEEIYFLQNLRFVSLWFHESLHAKCYANDSKMIITSLNLYEFSIINNKEMGVLIDKTVSSDVEMFEDALKEIEYIKSNSHKFEFISKRSIEESVSKGKEPGYCIRTGIKIPFNPEKPLSKEAFQIWNQYADEDYPEKYCHYSGEPSNGETSVAKPILRKNWNKAKESFR